MVTRHLYVHVPFCGRRCTYCDFAIAVRRVVPVREYIDAITAELVTRSEATPWGPLETLYLGGGTPSKLGTDGIGALISALRRAPQLRLADDLEITIEVNPEDVSPASAEAWAAAGVNRASVGVQSFNSTVLAWMHRGHGAEQVTQAVADLRAAGISDISVDLIFGVPASLGRNWSEDLQRAQDLGVQHLSVYGLTIEPHTPLGRWSARGEVVEGTEDSFAEEFLAAHETLRGGGFEHYEVSNYALPGHRSVHNSAYWRRVPYLGLGPSAHSFDGQTRRSNEREYESWRSRTAAGSDPVASSELLTEANRAAEDVYLGLRTDDGLELREGDRDSVEPWLRSGWGLMQGDRLILTAEGWLRLDSIAAVLTVQRSR